MHEAFMGGTAENHLAWHSILRSPSVADEVDNRLMFADYLDDQGKEVQARWQRLVADFIEKNQDHLFEVRYVTHNRRTENEMARIRISMQDSCLVTIPAISPITVAATMQGEVVREVGPRHTYRHTSSQLPLRYRIEQAMCRAWIDNGQVRFIISTA